MSSVVTQPYATPTDLANLGLAAQALSVVSAGEQMAALLSASAEADGYLNTQYVLPLISWGTDLTTHVCEIAAFRLLSSRGYNPDQNSTVRDRFKDAVQWFQQVAADKLKPIVVDSSVTPGGPSDGQGGNTGFSVSVGAPINQCQGDVPGGGYANFWNNSDAATSNLRGGGGRTRGF